MPQGLPYSLRRAGLKGAAVGARGSDAIPKKQIPFDVTVNVADGAPGFGTVVIGGLPEGRLHLKSAVLYCELSDPNGDLDNADFEGDVAVGSAPTADNSLAGAEVDVVPSTGIGPATTGVANVVAENLPAAPVSLDNTDGALELNLQVLIDDIDISGAAALRARGTLHLDYLVMGDD